VVKFQRAAVRTDSVDVV